MCARITATSFARHARAAEDLRHRVVIARELAVHTLAQSRG